MVIVALAWLFFTLFLFTLENHWFLFFNTTQSPDLLLLFLLLYAMDRGKRNGAVYGLGIGALLDVVTFSYFGWHMVTRAALGYLIGKNRVNMFVDRLPPSLILTGDPAAPGGPGTVPVRDAGPLAADPAPGPPDPEAYGVEPGPGPCHVVPVPQTEETGPQPYGLLLSSVGVCRAE